MIKHSQIIPLPEHGLCFPKLLQVLIKNNFTSSTLCLESSFNAYLVPLRSTRRTVPKEPAPNSLTCSKSSSETLVRLVVDTSSLVVTISMAFLDSSNSKVESYSSSTLVMGSSLTISSSVFISLRIIGLVLSNYRMSSSMLVSIYTPILLSLAYWHSETRGERVSTSFNNR